MATKIRIKHSATANDTPTAAQIPDAGELAINTNSTSLRLFARDSAGDVRVIGGNGTGGTGALGYWSRTGTTLSPVNSSDSLSVSGLGTFGGGLRVNGGTVNSVINGLSFNSGSNTLFVVNNASSGDGRLELTNTGKGTIRGSNAGFSVLGGITGNSGLSNGFRCAAVQSVTINRFNAYQAVNDVADTQTASIAAGFSVFPPDTAANGSITDKRGFEVTRNSATGTSNNYGFYSDIATASAGAFNYFANGTAPNFFAGSTYIGGNTTRNTRELWESLLTEEQKEELAAGTLAIPANVETPGDGEFIRQWWYDRQSAEDQALIDAGELEYPEHLQPENFVDTFTLGDNTVINLNAAGGIRFNGGAANTSHVYGQPGSVSLSDATDRRVFIGPFGAVFSPRSTPATFSTVSNTGYVFQHNTVSGNATTESVACVSTNLTVDCANNNVDDISGIEVASVSLANSGNLQRLNGYRCSNALLNSSTNTAAFRAQIEKGNGSNFNFYAEGNAPNYFEGNVTCNTGLFNRGELHVQSATSGPNFPGAGNNETGFRVQTSGVSSFSANHADAASFVTLFNRSNFNGTLLSFRKNGAERGSITIDDSNITITGQTSDYRVKTNIQPVASAVSKVKSLNVVNFEYTDRALGETQEGFIAHELAEICPKAVVGTKDATEAIGTMTDAEGVETTNVTEPEAVAYGATWVQTGTRPVYQGVDQSKLIPLLTKALQEALERIEVLEAAAAGG